MQNKTYPFILIDKFLIDIPNRRTLLIADVSDAKDRLDIAIQQHYNYCLRGDNHSKSKLPYYIERVVQLTKSYDKLLDKLSALDVEEKQYIRAKQIIYDHF